MLCRVVIKMMISIKEDNTRFSARAGAIIYNEDRSKVLLENQGKFYRFPGGRIDFGENSKTAILRELKEELGIDIKLNLKYIAEMVLNISTIRYHEIGFYFMTFISEKMISNNFDSLDDDNHFEWVNVSELDKYDVVAKPIKEKVMNGFLNDDLEYMVYTE